MSRKNRIWVSSEAIVPIESTSDRLAKIALFYDREAKRCAAKRAYLAASILNGAAIEALLLSMCYVEDAAVRRTAIYKNKRFRSKRNRFFEFSLFQLINVAVELRWIPTREIELDGRKTTLQDLLHAARETRNMIHPAAWSKEGGPDRPRKGTYESVLEVFDVTREWLVHTVMVALRRKSAV